LKTIPVCQNFPRPGDDITLNAMAVCPPLPHLLLLLLFLILCPPCTSTFTAFSDTWPSDGFAMETVSAVKAFHTCGPDKYSVRTSNIFSTAAHNAPLMLIHRDMYPNEPANANIWRAISRDTCKQLIAGEFTDPKEIERYKDKTVVVSWNDLMRSCDMNWYFVSMSTVPGVLCPRCPQSPVSYVPGVHSPRCPMSPVSTVPGVLCPPKCPRRETLPNPNCGILHFINTTSFRATPSPCTWRSPVPAPPPS